MARMGRFTVAQVEERTGVPAGTLRQWERRYGVPNPERSAAGYRLYGDDDLRLVALMQRHIADGVPASRAAELARRAPPPESGAQPPGALRRRLVDAFAALDENAADLVLSEAYALHPVETVVAEVLAGAMVDVGERWHDGTLAVTTEHFASSYVQGSLRHQLSVAGAGPRGALAVVACAPHDTHELASLMLALLLRRAGYRVLYLGANTPAESLLAMARETRPAWLMVSASSKASIDLLAPHAAGLARSASHLVFGGSAFDADPSRAAEIGGTYLADNVRDAIARMDAPFEGAGGAAP